MDLNLMKVQAFILTYVNEDRRNIVHLACYFGNLELLSFLMERARFLDIEEQVVHAVDEMELPPFYLLCERGYRQKFCATKQRNENLRQQMIEVMIPKGKFDFKSIARWDHAAR